MHALQCLADSFETCSMQNCQKHVQAIQVKASKSQNNQIQKHRTKKTSKHFQQHCSQSSEFNCTLNDCIKHPRKKGSFGTAVKTWPTLFGRTLPICWTIAGVQFLAAIDWPQPFVTFLQKQPEHCFSRFFDLIHKAKHDLSQQRFNAAPAAAQFIQKFKSNLDTSKIDFAKGFEEDWSLLNEHDSSEFIACFLGNIDKLNKNAPRAFFSKKLTKLQRQMVQFVNDNLSVCTKEKLECTECNHTWFGMKNKTIKQSMITLSFPFEKEPQQTDLTPEKKKTISFQKQSMQQLLDDFLATEKLDRNHQCDECKQAGKTKKRFVFTSAPKYLIINLKRFQFGNEQNQGKIAASVNFNEVIKVTTSDGHRSYELIAALNHVGESMNKGHYTTTKRVNNQLFECNDDHHVPVNKFHETNGYCFLYVKTTRSASKFQQNQKSQNQQEHKKNVRSKVTGKRKMTIADLPTTRQPPTKKQKVTKAANRKRRRSSRAVKMNVKRQKLNRKQSKNPSETKQQQMQCPFCIKSFKTQQGLNSHIGKMHKNQITHECSDCGKIFGSQNRLNKHSEEVHASQGAIKCPHCSECYENDSSLKSHIGKMHKSHVSHECPDCGKIFGSRNRLNKHSEKVHASSQKADKCPHCSECYENEASLKRHIGKMHKKKVEPFNSNFDFTQALDFPTWQEIKDYRHRNPHYNAAGFLKMIGKNVRDPRLQPDNVSFIVNKTEMLTEWKEHMKHSVPIETCATCGRLIILTEVKHHLLPITSKLLNCCKADQNELPPKDSRRYKALHLVELNNEIFKLCQQGIKGERVIVCNACRSNLVYSKKTGVAPINTFAHYDLGKMPDSPDLPKLTFGEKLAISKVIVFVPQIQLKPVYGKSNKGIKGHAFGIKASQEDVLNSLVKMLPRHDLGDVVQISFCGTKEMWPVAKEILKQGDLHIRMDVIMLWLSWLKAVKNPEFIDITIPTNDHEQAEARKMLEASVEKILDNAFQSTSARIARVSDHVRSEVIDEREGLNDDIDADASLIRRTLITEETQSQEPMRVVLEQIKQKLSNVRKNENQQHKLQKTLHADLMNEYTENHRLLSAAFPHIFPLGLPAEAMGTATVPKLMRET